jgi:hypothetical protein
LKMTVGRRRTPPPQTWVPRHRWWSSSLPHPARQAWKACLLSRAPLEGALLSKVMTGGSRLRRTGRNLLPRRLVCSTWLQTSFGGPTWRTNTWVIGTCQGDTCLELAGVGMPRERHPPPPVGIPIAPGGRTGLPLVAGGVPHSEGLDLGPAGIAEGPVLEARTPMGNVQWLG